MHGTISKEERTARLASYSRAELRDGVVIELREGKPADSLVYEDADFSVNVVGQEATSSGRRMTTNVLICQKPDEAGAPIRWRQTLFYCGKFYDPSGNVVSAVPDDVLQSMDVGWQSAEQRTGPFGERAKLVFVVGRDGALLVTRSLSVMSPLKLGVWPIDGKEVAWTTVSAGNPGQQLLVANGLDAYSPNRVVLEDSPHHWIGCQQSECKPLDRLSASGSYLLIDDQAGETITLSLPNLAQPRLLVHSTKL